MNILIVGGGVAAFEAAVAARKQSADCSITICSAENVPPYRRPALPGLIFADEEELARIFIRKESFYAENRIELRLNMRLTAVDPQKHEAVFNDETRLPYDKLILATGGRAFVPPVPGSELDTVLTLRTLEDLKKLRSRLKAGAGNVVIIGGGILGLEIADALLRSGAAVSVLENADRLLSRNISPEDSLWMMGKLEQIENFKLICCASTREITPQGVVLEDGRVIPGDLVIFSTGSRPVLAGIPQGIGVDRGILVDSHMQSSLPDIYACGDNAQFKDSVCGLYTTARAMAAIAGNCAAGGNDEYIPKQNNIMLNTLGFKMSNDGKVTEK